MNKIEKKITYVIQVNEDGRPAWYWRDKLSCREGEGPIMELKRRFREDCPPTGTGRLRLAKRTEEIEVLAERDYQDQGWSDERD